MLSRGAYVFLLILRYSPLNGTIYILNVIVTAFMAPLQIYSLQKLIDSISGVHQNGMKSVILYGGVFIFSLIIVIFLNAVSNVVQMQIKNDLFLKQTPVLIKKFQNIYYECFEKKDLHDMMHCISQNPQDDIMSVFLSVLNIVYSFIYCLGVLIMFFKVSILLGSVAIIISIPMFYADSNAAKIEMKLRWTMTTDIRKRYYLQQLFVDRDALIELKVYNFKKYILELIQKYNKKINHDYKKTIYKVLVTSSVSSFCLLLFIFLASVQLLKLLLAGTITIGVFVSIFNSLNNYYQTLFNSIASVSRYIRLSYTIQYFQDFLKLPERYKGDGKDWNDDGIHSVRFDHVYFSYPDSDKMILKDLSFEFDSNQHISFVGENGAGKSTIIKLLCGLYKPTKGEIYVDNVNLNQLSDKQRQSLLTVIFQDFQNYELTVRENVAFGNIDKINNDEIILHAMKKADIQSILKPTIGLDMNLGKIEEDGVNLSLGQWQRLAISRVYLANASFIIMDEPTASLDPVAENGVYTQFYKFSQMTGTITISHRLASAKMADIIYVISDGSIKEFGNHEELMEHKKLYYKMFMLQSSWYS